MLDYDLRERAIERFENGDHLKIRILTRANTKLEKGEKIGVMTTGVSFAPASTVALKTICSHSNKQCVDSCLATSGMGQWHMIRKDGSHSIADSRALKTIWWERDREGFIVKLKHELKLFQARAERAGMIAACRLNILSDIMWQTETDVMQSNKEINFYGYSKVPAFKNLPDNYHVTFSRSGTNDKHVKKAIKAGINVAVVFEGNLPKTWRGIPVINGDETDARFLDPKNVIVGLRAKGSAKNPNISGSFVVRESRKKTHVLIDRLAA